MASFAIYYNGTPKQRGEDFIANIIRVTTGRGQPLTIEAESIEDALTKAKSEFPFLGTRILVGEAR